jgi:pimeloyl-ACP methyl ester carboxylesterase
MHPNIEKGTIMNWRKQTVILLAALPVLLTLAACQGEATPLPTPTAVPTVAAPTAVPTEEVVAEPTAEPTAAPTEAAAAAATSAGAAAWAPATCESLGVQAEIAALSDCGFVTVPENRAADTGKTIQLAVVRIRSSAETPGAPVILGTGGPGDDGLGRLKLDPAFLAARAGILESRDWIGFTQRGTPGAQPELACPEFDRVPLDAAMQGLTLEANLALRAAALQTCLDRYAAEGVDLTAYNSVENAADVVAVIDALGYDKVYYYGQSYGTMLGQYLVQDHADRLAGIILDGIAPLTYKTWTITDFPAAYQRVFAACAADAACDAAYPEPEAALATGLQALDANPPSLTVKTAEGELAVSVDSTLAMRALFMTLYTPGGYATVPWLAYELRDGNFAPLTNNIPMLFETSGSLAKLMHFAVVCSDDPIFSLDDVVTDGVPPMYQGVQVDDLLDYATACPLLALPQLPDRYDEPAESEIPALLLQGGLDPATGVPAGSTVQEGLPNSTNVIFPASGHIVGNSPCGIALMDAFMRDPQAALDTSCVDPAVPFSLPGPVSVTSPDGSVTLGITLPGGYSPSGPGIWQGVDAYVGLTIEEPGTTADAAVAQQLALLGVTGEATDGLEIAGLPSRMARVAHPAGDLEVYGIADADRSYAVFILVKASAKAEEFRQNEQPALLESVTLGGE